MTPEQRRGTAKVIAATAVGSLCVIGLGVGALVWSTAGSSPPEGGRSIVAICRNQTSSLRAAVESKYSAEGKYPDHLSILVTGPDAEINALGATAPGGGALGEIFDAIEFSGDGDVYELRYEPSTGRVSASTTTGVQGDDGCPS